MRGMFSWLSRRRDVPVEGPPSTLEQQIQIDSGAIEFAEPKTPILQLKKKLPPRCVGCKRFMGKDDGFQLYINERWRFHTNCFDKMVDKEMKDNPDEMDVISNLVRPSRWEE